MCSSRKHLTRHPLHSEVRSDLKAQPASAFQDLVSTAGTWALSQLLRPENAAPAWLLASTGSSTGPIPGNNKSSAAADHTKHRANALSASLFGTLQNFTHAPAFPFLPDANFCYHAFLQPLTKITPSTSTAHTWSPHLGNQPVDHNVRSAHLI